MISQLFRNWWLYLVRAALAILFGILALIWPGATKLALVVLFGAFVLPDDIFAVATSVAFHGYFNRWWTLLLEGITGIVIGVLSFFWPGITTFVLLALIAAWAVVTGFLEILAAIHFRRVILGEWALVLAGLLSVLFGALLFAFPTLSQVGLMWLIGIYAIAFGIFEMIFAFRLHGLGQDIKQLLPVDI